MFAKTDLHLHLDGSLPLGTILRLAHMQHIEIPADTKHALKDLCVVRPECRSLAAYLERFALPLKVLQTENALYIATCDLLRVLAAEGLTYAEIRFAPQLHGERGLRQAGAIEAVLRATRENHGLTARVILCMMTTGTHSDNAETASLAARYHAQGVCGLDLAGQEGAQPMREFAPFFAQAVENGVHVTIHAGEACGAQSVADALDCGAQRIGHGTRAIEDPAVMRRIIEKGVTLEQCVTSNIQTGCAASLAQHPIRRLFDAGVRIAVCTDNRTVSDVTLQGEYEILQTKLGFHESECAKLAQYAKEAAFF